MDELKNNRYRVYMWQSIMRKKDEDFRVEPTKNKVLPEHKDGFPGERWELNIYTFS